ncbi:MAG TPA: hypothetical protein DCS43_01400 [Verrucomicrobia bacterium]|nr:hypothetical protein [Verrucomicrobiota bacterium]
MTSPFPSLDGKAKKKEYDRAATPVFVLLGLILRVGAGMLIPLRATYWREKRMAKQEKYDV